MTLSRDDLYSLEQYSEIRPEYRAKVMAHKKDRAVPLGPNATLYFEDQLTIQYQIQEMLRIEKIFDADGINEELETYNPLIPDGNNWKATFMIEFEDVAERQQALADWIGIEKTVWVKVGNFDKVFAICNEDLDRERDDKTSSVHFMRFQLTDEMVAAVCAGEPVSAGIDLAQYTQLEMPLEGRFQQALRADLTCD